MMMMMLLLRCLVSTASFCRSPFILTPEFQRLTSWRTVAGRMSISLSPSNNGSVCLSVSIAMAYCFLRMFVAFTKHTDIYTYTMCIRMDRYLAYKFVFFFVLKNKSR